MLCPIAFAKSTLPTPNLRNQAGGLLSNFQFSTAPLTLFASMKTTMCGLIQSTFVTVPVDVNRLDISKMAEGEGCAHTNPAAASRTRTTRAPESLYFKEIPPFELWGEYIIQDERPYPPRARSLLHARKQALRNHRVHAFGPVH